MGVNQLWGILAPIKRHKSLKSLQGQTIVVDLSVWICESSSALQGLPVAKPHLRNLFFRVTNLTQLGVNLIFVLDGEPPELKWDEMERRTNSRFEAGARGRGKWGHWRSKRSKTTVGAAATSGSVAGAGKKKKKERKQFKFVVKECQEMLETLGVPCVQAAGEAEAMCALMNVQGLADACLTEDGDVFLYGARTVYKNFTLNAKDPHIECYSMDDIESSLGLDQSKLIALGLLLGCDYTLGVPGVGPKQAVGLMKQLGSDVEVLERFRDWASGRIPRICLQDAPKKSPHCSRCTHEGSGREHKVYGCAMCNSDAACHPKSVTTPECLCSWHVSTRTRGKASLEPDVMKKACAIPDFPSEPVIEEFLSVKDKCPTRKLIWKRPQLISAQKFVSSKLEWPEDYTVEKVFPLVTLWDLTAISSGHSFDPKLHLTPTEVIKRRVRQGVACVEVQWQTGIPHLELEFPTTIEKEELFAKAFPDLMTAFEEAKAAKTKQKRKKIVKSTKKDILEDNDHLPTGNEDDLDCLTSAVGELSLVPRPIVQRDNESSLQVESDVHLFTSLDHSDLSETEDCSDVPLSLHQRLKLSSDSTPNFSLKFELTNLIENEISGMEIVKSTKKDSLEDNDHLPTNNEDDLDCLTSAVGELSLVPRPNTQPDNVSSPQLQSDVHQFITLDHSDLFETEDCSELPLSLHQRLNLSPDSTPNFSLKFELTKLLTETSGAEDVELVQDDSLASNLGCLESEPLYMSAFGREHLSSLTPAGNLCHTFSPLPIDVDTPLVDNESFLGASNQSEPSRLIRTGQNGPLITTPLSTIPSHSVNQSGAAIQTAANQKPERSLNNQLESILHEVENSPVSLLDRLRRKHGNQNGVLSAALAMKNASKFGGKRGRERKVLMDIFDDDNESDDIIS